MKYGILFLFLGWMGPAYAEGVVCSETASSVKAKVEHRKGTWRELDANQFQFLRGIYAMNPMTPPGLPIGDHAALAMMGENGMVFFEDGKLACFPMEAPKKLRDLLDKVGSGKPVHEGDGT